VANEAKKVADYFTIQLEISFRYSSDTIHKFFPVIINEFT
jgi:hypothetical protein